MDNALEKLIEEIRAANNEIDEAHAAHQVAGKAVGKAIERINAAQTRAKLLEDTLQDHIRNGTPIIQAKMIAHEKLADLTGRSAAKMVLAVDPASSQRGAITIVGDINGRLTGTF